MTAHKVAGLPVAWIAAPAAESPGRRELRHAAMAELVRSGEAGPLIAANDGRALDRAIARAMWALRCAVPRRMLPGPKS